MLSFDITMRREIEYNGQLKTDPPAHHFFAPAPAPIATMRLLAGCILVRFPNSKHAGRASIAAQKTFQIVHFLAGTGGLAEPAAELL